MKWKLTCCVILLVCLMLPTGHVMSETGATVVMGSVALVAYEVSLARIGHFTAAISWKTNGDATSQVFYDTVSHSNIGDYVYCTSERTALAQRHKMTLNKLSPFTTYHYRVRSAAGGREFVSDDYSFTTLLPPGRPTGLLANLFLQFIYPLHLCWLW
jgi:hypothetical protein